VVRVEELAGNKEEKLSLRATIVQAAKERRNRNIPHSELEIVRNKTAKTFLNFFLVNGNKNIAAKTCLFYFIV